MDKQPYSSRGLANHILPTTANLLGICFVIFSISHLQNSADASWLDEFCAAAILVFLFSCLFSYASLRSPKYRHLEIIADISFILGLFLMAIPVTLIAIKYMH